MASKPKITLYLDIVSPFAYMAFHVLETSPLFKQCDITYTPILLGGVMQKTGNTPPINIKNKDKWIESERHRWAKAFNVPIMSGVPDNFPPNTVTVQRALCAVQLGQPERLGEVFGAAYRAFWVENKAIQKPEVIAEALAEVLGKDGAKEVMNSVGKPEVKKALIENTDLSLKEGCFGLPWFVCTNAEGKTEGFWGMDHLGVVVEFLGLDRREGGQQGFRSLL